MSEIPVPSAAIHNPLERQARIGAATRWRSGILRAMFYAPIVLLTSAFAAVAMFPEIAEYATPLIDLNRAKHCTAVVPIEGRCTSQMQELGNTCPTQLPAAVESDEAASFLSSADQIPVDATSTENAIDTESPSN